MTLIRYRLPAGDRFTIDARSRETIGAGEDELVDLDVAFSLECSVVSVHGDAVEIDGRFADGSVRGHVLGGTPPALLDLDGAALRVRKGLNGWIHEVDGGEPFERLLGGLTVANALRWFGASFADREVDVGDTWTGRDRWTLRSDASPLGIALPVEPVVDLTYRYRLAGLEGVEAVVAVRVEARGGGTSDALGVALEVRGEGTGEVRVDLERGKLTRSVREATLDVVSRPLRRGALALPRLSVRRTSEAGFRGTT